MGQSGNSSGRTMDVEVSTNYQADGGDGENDISYWKSTDFRELVVCIAFFLATTAMGIFDPLTRQRPIPYWIDASGTYQRNLYYNETFDSETVSDFLLIVLGIGAPLISQFLIAHTCKLRQDRHATVCVYAVATGTNLLVVASVKMYVGYLRPIFYDICGPSEDYQTCENDTNSIRKSFPSGHASTSFCGLMLLTLFIHTRFGLPSVSKFVAVEGMPGSSEPIHYRRTYSHRPYRARLVSVLSLFPLALATFIATSRLVDNKHHPADVVGGAVIGSSIAVFTHSLWFI